MLPRCWTFLKNLLATDRRSHSSRKARRSEFRRLEWEMLEPRCVPAVTATFSGGLLTVTEGAANDSATLTGTLAAGTTINVTGTGGFNTTYGPAATGATAVTAIMVKDSGSNAGQSVTLTSAAGNAINVTGNISITGIESITISTATTLQANQFTESGATAGVSLDGNVATDLGQTFNDAVTLEANSTLTENSGSGTFQAAQNFASGSGPYAVAVADFNHDGKLDLVTANNVSNTVSVLMGNGDGTFQAAQNFAVGDEPVSVIVGDFNGDGKLDIATADESSNSVSILLGNGDGTFQAAQNFAVGDEPLSVAVGDFNGDNKLDLVTANAASNTASVLLGNGDGTFQAAQNFAVGENPEVAAVGDFNGDSKEDLVVANEGSNTLSVLLGNGDGTFQTAQNFAVGENPETVAVADFNGDGKLDLVSGNVTSNTVSVLLGNGNGTFQAAQNFATGTFPFAVAVGDLNGDHKLDLVTDIFLASGAGVSVLLGNGDGTFQAEKNYGTGAGPARLAIADLNGDGVPDIVTPDDSINAVSVLLGNGSIGNTVSFASTVNAQTPGTQGLTISGNVVFGGIVGGSTPLSTLTVTGTTTINTTAIGATNQDYSGAVTLGNTANLTGTTVTFGSTVDAASAGGQGLGLTVTNATFDGVVGTTALASLSVTGSTTINTTAITTSTAGGGSGTQNYTGAVILGTTPSLTGTSITFGTSVDATTNGAQGLTITGNAAFNCSVGVGGTALANLSVSGTTLINTPAITTAGTQTYSSDISLGRNTDLTGPTINVLRALILGATPTTATQTLTVGGVGDVLNLSAATVVTSTLASASSYGSITATSGTVKLNNATLSLTYQGGFTPAANSMFTIVGRASGTFSGLSTPPGPYNLNGTNYNITYTGGAGSDFVLTALAAGSVTPIYVDSHWAGTPNGNQPATDNPFGGLLAFNTNAFADIPSAIAKALATPNSQLVIFASSIFYTVPVNFNLPGNILIETNSASPTETTVTLTGAVTLSVATSFVALNSFAPGGGFTPSGPASLTFGVGATINGGQTLNISSDTTGQTVTFGDTVGNSTPLTSLTVSGPVSTVLTNGSVKTTGTQEYSGAVTLGANATLVGTTVKFDSTVDASAVGAESLTVTGAGVFGGTIGGSKALSALSISGTSAINTAAITTSNLQTYSAAVTLGQSTTLTGSTVTFSSTVDALAPGVQGLTVMGSADFLASVGAGTKLNNLAVSNTTDLNGPIVDTTGGSQTYSGPVILTTNVTLKGSVDFKSTVDDQTAGMESLTITGTGEFDGVVGGNMRLSSLSVGSTTIIDTSSISTTGTQSYGGPVILDISTTLNVSTVTFSNMVNGTTGAEGLTVNGAATFIGAFIGNSVALSTFTVTGLATVLTNTSVSAGTVNFMSNLLLGANASSATNTLSVTGSALNLSGALTSTLTGTGASQFGHIVSNSATTIASNAVLNVSLGGGYTPQAGDSFDLIPHESGVFGNAPNGSTLTLNGFNFLVEYDDLLLVYQPQMQFLASSTTITLILPPSPVSANAANPIVGQPYLLTVELNIGGGPYYQTGSTALLVTFYDGGVALGTAQVNASGNASFDAVFSTAGTHSIHAYFSGTPNLSSSNSLVFNITVLPQTVVVAPHVIVAGAGPGGGPLVNVYDASTGDLITSFYAFAPTFTGGVRVAVADVNGDGTPDIICGAGPGGGPEVAVFDGKTFQEIMNFEALPAQFTGGVWVAAGDVNGDGYADIVTAADAGGGPEVTITSGKDGSLLAGFYATASTFTGGIRVACADLNNDGFADVIAAAGPGGGPQVTIFDGKSLKLLTAFYALPPTFTGGMYVSAGDLNGDGHADIIVGAEKGGGPEVNVFNGAGISAGSGMPPSLYAFYALPPQFTGGVRVGYSSNFEGHEAILSVAGPGGGPQLSIFDGLTMANLDSFYAFAPTFGGGVYVGGN